MGAYEGLTRFFHGDLCDLAARLEYSAENLCVLRGDAAELQRRFPETYENILSCEHNKDKRNPLEYAKDIVASWLFEDYLVAKVRREGRCLRLVGGDRERKLLPNSRVSSSSDCVYGTGKQELSVEIMNSYTSFWQTNRCLHLRDHKYQQLCRERGALLCIDTQNCSYGIVDFTQEKPPAKYIESHRPYGGKSAYELSLLSVTFCQFLVRNVIHSSDVLCQTEDTVQPANDRAE